MIKYTEYWEIQCDKCGNWLYDDTGNTIFRRFQPMLDLADSKGWTRKLGFKRLCSECSKGENNERR